MNPMRALFLDVPDSLLDERRRLGLDRFDELWEGVLHVVPPPSKDHQNIMGTLQSVLWLLLEGSPLRPTTDTGYWSADNDYRVPDLVVATDEVCSARGVEGPAALVVEIRSPNDETDAKLGWYAQRGVGEVLTIDPPTRSFKLFSNHGGRLVVVQADDTGWCRSRLGFDIRSDAVDGGRRLRVRAGARTVSL